MKTFTDINKRFTEIVADYIAHGAVINAGTMVGHEGGEVAKVDLVWNGDVIRVLMEEGDKAEGDFKRYRFIGITVGVACKARANDDPTLFTHIWNSELDIVSKETWYRLNDYCGDKRCVYGTFKEAAAVESKREERAANRRNDTRMYHRYSVSGGWEKLAAAAIKRKLGLKRVKVKDAVLFINGEGERYISYHGKTVVLA